MKQLLCILALVTLVQSCPGQPDGILSEINSESLEWLTDSLVSREVASFTQKGLSFELTDSLTEVVLTEVPISYCSEREVYLSLSTSKLRTHIHFYFRGENLNRMLDSIFLVIHSHYWVKFPVSAFKELPQSNSCDFSRDKRHKMFYSPYYKAFYSEDKNRLYIYMLGGSETARYEVTWVIKNGYYYTRIIDQIL